LHARLHSAVNQTYLLNLEDIILKKLEQVRPLYSLSLSLSLSVICSIRDSH